MAVLGTWTEGGKVRVEAEAEAQAKPKFLSKEERAALALARRAAEVEEKKAKESEERQKRQAFAEEAQKAYESQREREYRERKERERRERDERKLDDFELKALAKKKEEERLAAKAEKDKEKEMEAVRNRYLGSTSRKKRGRRLHERKFVFDWDASEDTAVDYNPIYKDRHQVQLFGRGNIGGIDIKTQKKEKADFYAKLMEDRRSNAQIEQEAIRIQRVPFPSLFLPHSPPSSSPNSWSPWCRRRRRKPSSATTTATGSRSRWRR